METLIINKKGKSKFELLQCLEKIKDNFTNEINKYDIKISKIEDGYSIKGEKRILIKFFVEMEIYARDEFFEIKWKTNVPESKVEEAIEQIRNVLEINCK